ncbi:hypothetical protein BT69DRAFT_1316190 [Atractiella rhizophila]|nr:hypothetical protein BT69DRAFT_1316190 [Atractiella rhizophila]
MPPTHTQPGSILLIAPSSPEDTKTPSSTTRYFRNSIPGRIIESTVSTSRASISSLTCIGPWGDANPVVLPTFRARDVVLLGVDTATGGASGVLDAYGLLGGGMGGAITGAVVDEVVGDYTEEGVDKILDKDDVKRIDGKCKNIVTLVIRIKHSFHNEHAVLGFWKPEGDEKDSQTNDEPTAEKELEGNDSTESPTKKEKAKAFLAQAKSYFDTHPGWFSPYLMATKRLPAIPRTLSPTLVMFYAPLVPGDLALAHHLLSHMHSVIRPASPSSKHQMLITALGVKPLTGAIWASSRRPEEGKLKYLLGDGVPALIVPVKDGTPTLFWSGKKHVDPQDLFEFLSVVMQDRVDKEEVRDAVDGLCKSLENLREMKAVNGDRVGVVGLRYEENEETTDEEGDAVSRKKRWWKRKK